MTVSFFAASVIEFELVAIGVPFAKVGTPEIIQNGFRSCDRDPAVLFPELRLVELVTILGLWSAHTTNARRCMQYDIYAIMCNGQCNGLPSPGK